MKRYSNGYTVFDADDLAALDPNRDPNVPLTDGQLALLAAIIGTDEPDEPSAP